jgi:hypothetical protein
MAVLTALYTYRLYLSISKILKLLFLRRDCQGKKPDSRKIRSSLNLKISVLEVLLSKYNSRMSSEEVFLASILI